MMPSDHDSYNVTFDMIGVGIGPSNLSLCALNHGLPDHVRKRLLLLDEKKRFGWHEGLSIPNSMMQTSFLKDLVTPVAPHNPFSFISYLHDNGLFYKFINTNRTRITREEFSQYCSWVSSRVPGLLFQTKVVSIVPNENCGDFTVHTDRGQTFKSRNIIVGVGRSPFIPESLNYNSPRVFHSSRYREHKALAEQANHICVVGGGQSGAEIVLDLLRNFSAKTICWITRRPIYAPLDDSPFTNELFLPDYVEHFHRQSTTLRTQLLREQSLASDGISPETLEEIYRHLYHSCYVAPSERQIRLLPRSEVVKLEGCDSSLRISFTCEGHGLQNIATALVVFATGYQESKFEFLHPCQNSFDIDPNGFLLNFDYSVPKKNLAMGSIYIQNGGKLSHGVADPNLSLMAWRSACILNSLAKKPIFSLPARESFLSWPTEDDDAAT